MRIVLLFCGFLIFACGNVGMEISGDEQELYQNHLLLKAYFFHPERIKEYEEYKSMKVDSMYKKVDLMYESLEDYFCGANFTGVCQSRYTFYLPPEEYDDRVGEIENTKRYYSFGFERRAILNDDESVDTLIVSAVYPISPAASAGLRKKDRLLSANGISLTNLTDEEAVAYVKNDDPFDNSTVFEVLRDGKIETLKAMQKGEVQKPTVYLDSLEGVPLIRITEYKVNTNNPKGTYTEFRNVLQEIKGAKVAIMDLRGNPGGNIGHCTAMAAELVPLKSELVYDVQHYRDRKRGNVIETSHDYASDFLKQEGLGVNIKWIILMSRGSASCSERFTAAVKYNRPETVVIGQTSYGKGVGQIYTKTYMGGLAYITCLQTYYPDGTTFHNIGIIPDIQTEAGDIDALREEAIKAARGFGAAAKPSTMPASLESLPPERLADKWEPAANKRIEFPLFHQGE
ncbi:MAG: S41 family peptidase [Fibromonadales bacterium]|nr:S41 family peptidase [Fibromonadales bacterium]